MNCDVTRHGRAVIATFRTHFMAASDTVIGDAFVAEKPWVWIAKLGRPKWDQAPDGKHVVVLTPVESAEAPKPEHEVVFLENFFDELRWRVALGK